MLNLILVPLTLLLLAAGGLALCMTVGWNPHWQELIAALVVSLAASMLAITPSLLLRNSDSATLSQSGLVGTVLHMFLTIIFAALVWMAGIAERHGAFLYWLLAFYWASLTAVVTVSVRLIRRAEPAPVIGTKP